MSDSTSNPSQQQEPLRLHIGGKRAKPGWKIFNIMPGPAVDFVGDCRDLSSFADASVDEIYASHVYEHVSYARDLPQAFREAYRVLKPGGRFYVGVPDLEALCRLFIRPDFDKNQRFWIMRIIYGGQVNEYDFHKAGLTQEFLAHLFSQAGFVHFERVQDFGVFEDASSLTFQGNNFTLNMIATK
jgi:predicted SAM-dependent methyltransferase